MKTRLGFTVMLAAALFTALAVSCGGDGGKGKYGQVLAKKSADKKIIQRVQDSTFQYNANVSLKEAIASNPKMSDVTWDVFPAQKQGASVVIVEGDVPFNFVFRNTDQFIITPDGEANFLSWFIYLDSAAPYDGTATAGQLKTLIKKYRKEYIPENGNHPFITDFDRIPESGPYKGFEDEPYFKLEAAHFHTEIFTEPSTEALTFTVFKFIFDISTPYVEDDQELYQIAFDLSGEDDLEAGLAFIYGFPEYVLSDLYPDRLRQMVFTPNYAWDYSIY